MLGAHSQVMGVGDTESMIFNTDDCGPWYLTPKQLDLLHHDRTIGQQMEASGKNHEDSS